MIIYKDILKKLDEAGYSTYQLRKEKVLSESVISRLRNNQDVSLTTLDTICYLTGLGIEDLVEYKPDTKKCL
ncbi:helix-turn-helix transcriptional regulator [Coprococcus eutactus]|jgi:putative transcriptional regulator|uniref:Helix-turn-helix transcriptional regulator n=1 Tax=Coprococcus hominis (ex Liu et al. 2022) TaxID=2763039 RepID=A0A8I0AQA2_9FIRM|nr:MULTISPECIES: helix-turn-helix transcriptional regulator [Coprococcus]MBC5663093.1 helix-turn-helix transcriptional regulator [Coprococcus hominis (ex Liu et al. 2022)]MCB5504108.1 helix-turn-helix transcriptional regulator [Coprococcus eutactus]NSC95925.1 helix-turn-helix transcriptional regulator [Coprococcus eutactus]NSD35040.1 helix-turn-helix transcriptional regulator [Coprococcus eutactus]